MDRWDQSQHLGVPCLDLFYPPASLSQTPLFVPPSLPRNREGGGRSAVAIGSPTFTTECSLHDFKQPCLFSIRTMNSSMHLLSPLALRTLEVVASVQSVPEGSLSLKPSTWQTKGAACYSTSAHLFVTVCARVQRDSLKHPSPSPILSFFSTKRSMSTKTTAHFRSLHVKWRGELRAELYPLPPPPWGVSHSDQIKFCAAIRSTFLLAQALARIFSHVFSVHSPPHFCLFLFEMPNLTSERVFFWILDGLVILILQLPSFYGRLAIKRQQQVFLSLPPPPPHLIHIQIPRICSVLFDGNQRAVRVYISGQ